jgi:hypothetical protein
MKGPPMDITAIETVPIRLIIEELVDVKGVLGVEAISS